jgi:hypothetical protein
VSTLSRSPSRNEAQGNVVWTLRSGRFLGTARVDDGR